jgi:hypothetical protein
MVLVGILMPLCEMSPSWSVEFRRSFRSLRLAIWICSALVGVLGVIAAYSAEEPVLIIEPDRSSSGESKQDKEPASAGEDEDDVVWRAERVCGCNCLYILLRGWGVQPDYLELRNELLQESLTSLTQLQQAGERRGLPCRMGKTDPHG